RASAATGSLRSAAGAPHSARSAQIGPAIELACALLAEWGAPAALRSEPVAADARLLANDIDHQSYEIRARPAE
ncbi:MAG: hypothetical protein ACK46T_32590, partial [Bradyrhizobium sp.]